MRVGTSTIGANPQYLATLRALGATNGGILKKNNDAVNGGGANTNYGAVQAGTVLARDSSGNLHPCGLSEATDGDTSTNIVELADADNFFVGDLVTLVKGATAGVTFAAGAGGATLTIAPKVGGLSFAIAVSGNNTPFAAAYDETLKRINITSATDGGGLATTTLEVIVEALKTTLGSLIESVSASSNAALAAATAATSLGSVKWDAVVSGRAVSAVDKTLKTVTLSGGAFDVSVGDILAKVNAYVPCGINDVSLSTLRSENDTLIAEDRTVTYRVEGDLRSSKIIGAKNDGLLRTALAGDWWPDPLNGGVLRRSYAGLVGFRFMDV
jgi:hypothetical protein